MTTQLLFDGRKAMSFQQLTEDLWVPMGNGNRHTVRMYSAELRKLYEQVGLLYRCVEIRADSLSDVPWVVANRAGKPVWKKDDEPPKELEWLEPLPELLRMTEAALCLGSQAYWHKERNRVVMKGIRWFAPPSIEPIWDEEKGLLRFDRRITGVAKPYSVEDIVYIWRKDPMHETLPNVSPAEAAMTAAGVLYSVDSFVTSFFDRGALKAMIISMKGNPPPAEKERVKAWWSRTMSGLKNAFKAEVVSADGVEATVVGEGIQELSNTDLTGEKRNDIATTMGIPHSMVFSDAANHATAQTDKRTFYDGTILPECNLIARQVNKQLLAPYGYHLEWRKDEMDIYQTDEGERADSLNQLVSAGMPLELATEILGYDLPDGWTYDMLKKPEPLPQTITVLPNQPRQLIDSQMPPVQDEGKTAELRRLRAWAKKRKHPDVTKFQSDILSDADKTAILSKMEGGADQDFFTLSLPEAITLEAYKAMVLQLDRDDDEAERIIREALERRTTRNLHTVFTEMLDTLYPQGYGEFLDPNTEAQRVRRLFDEEQKLYDVLSRALQDGADLGVSAAVTGLENTGFSFDWTLANESARAWASEHTGELVRGLSDTTQRGVQQTVVRWIENGEPLEALIHDLETYFGRARAERIAITEATRAYQQGNEDAWRASGVVAEMEWTTVRDERVCVQCGPMHGQRAPLGGRFEGDISPPPRHVRCRCFTRPVLKEHDQ